MFKRFLKDSRGSAPLWVAFCVIIFFMLGTLIYDVYTLYSKYYATQEELNRCAAITLDTNVVNPKLRDTITDMEYQEALDVLEANLLAKGWTRESGGWAKRANGRLNCRLANVSINVSGPNLHLTATVEIPLPWSIDGTNAARFPLDLYARILYIE